jgi:hypothetical protein
MNDAPTLEELAEEAGDGRRFKVQARSAPPPSGGAVYGLGMIGALVYFASSAETWQDYLLAFGKSMVWPALLVYRAFKVLGD